MTSRDRFLPIIVHAEILREDSRGDSLCAQAAKYEPGHRGLRLHGPNIKQHTYIKTSPRASRLPPCEAGAAVQTDGAPPRERARAESEKEEVLLRGVGTLRYYFPPNASVQWQPGDLTIHTNKWFLGAGFLGAPPIFLTELPGLSAGSPAAAQEGSGGQRICPSAVPQFQPERHRTEGPPRVQPQSGSSVLCLNQLFKIVSLHFFLLQVEVRSYMLA